MATAPFVIIPALAAVAVAYTQARCIADAVLPRVPVATQNFRYIKYAQVDAFQNPDTRVGRLSAPNQISWGSSEALAGVVDQGLDTPVPNADQLAWEMAQSAGSDFVSQVDPMSRATQLVMQSVMNRREARAASLVFNPANYAAANQATLSGTGQWSDYANSKPLTAILDQFDSMIMRPTHGAMGRLVATKLRSHPQICKAVFGMQTDAGIVPMRALADLLELEDIYVGDAFLNTANPGQAPAMSRAWGKHVTWFHRNMQAGPMGGVTFGFTAQWGPRIGGTIIDPDIGLRGGERVRAGESVIELITANDLGYFVQSAVA